VETTVALIVSKLILVLIFVVGLGMLVDGVGQAGSGGTQTVTQTIAGMLVLALAGFAPWVALKVVHFVGDQAHHLHLLASASTVGAARVYSVAQKAQPWVTGALISSPNSLGTAGGNGTGSNGSRTATFSARPDASPTGPPPPAGGTDDSGPSTPPDAASTPPPSSGPPGSSGGTSVPEPRAVNVTRPAPTPGTAADPTELSRSDRP
jgi:hypothetical protein